MPSTNGHGPKRAALYRRVSGEEQKQKGFSLPDQRAETLEYCARENLEVVREFEDAGYSGKFLERPDLDKLRDMVASGGVDIVVVSKRDRLARGLYDLERRGREAAGRRYTGAAGGTHLEQADAQKVHFE